MAPRKRVGKKPKKPKNPAAQVSSSGEQQTETPPAPPANAPPASTEALPSTSNNDPATSLSISHEETPATDPLEQNPGSDPELLQAMVDNLVREDKTDSPKQGRKVTSRGRPMGTQRESTPREFSVDEVDPTPGNIPNPFRYQHADRPTEPLESQPWCMAANLDSNDDPADTDPNSAMVRLAGEQVVMHDDTHDSAMPVVQPNGHEDARDDEQTTIPALAGEAAGELSDPVLPGAWPEPVQTPERNVLRSSVEDASESPSDQHRREESVDRPVPTTPTRSAFNNSSSVALSNAASDAGNGDDFVSIPEDEIRAFMANVRVMHEDLRRQNNILLACLGIFFLVWLFTTLSS